MILLPAKTRAVQTTPPTAFASSLRATRRRFPLLRADRDQDPVVGIAQLELLPAELLNGQPVKKGDGGQDIAVCNYPHALGSEDLEHTLRREGCETPVVAPEVAIGAAAWVIPGTVTKATPPGFSIRWRVRTAPSTS